MRAEIKKVFIGALLVMTLSGCASSKARKAYLAGADALEAGDLERASASFSAAVDEGMFLSQAYRGLGIVRMAENNYGDACIAFEKSLLNTEGESDEYIRDVTLYLAVCRERQGETDKAMELYNGLIRKSPDEEALFLRGRLNLRQGNSKEARSDFDQAVSIRSDYDLFINIFQLYEEEDRSGDGSYFLEEALAEASKKEDDYYNQGLVQYYLKNYEEARDMLIKAVKRDNGNMSAVFLLGKVYLAMGDSADARAVFGEYAQGENASAEAFNGLALCDIEDGQYETALRNVESGLAIDDGSAASALYFNEIVILEQMRDWSAAKAKAAAYVARYPADEAGLREYEFLSSR